MPLIARCTLPPEKFAWANRGFHRDGSVRHGKVGGGVEFQFHGTRAELDASLIFDYVEGEEDAPPAAVPARRKPGRQPKARAPAPEPAPVSAPS